MSKYLSTQEKGYHPAYSFLTSLTFLILLGLSVNYFGILQISTALTELKQISLTEFVVITFAIQRLTRLFVYDSVAQFMRDPFLDKEEFKEGDRIMVRRRKPEKGFRRFMADLIHCPWCTGMWISFFSVVIYLSFPETWIVGLILAFGGITTTLQLFANLIGWHAEKAKLECQQLGSHNREGQC